MLKVVFSVADQLVFTLTQFVVLMQTARMSTTDETGHYAVAVAVYSTLLGAFFCTVMAWVLTSPHEDGAVARLRRGALAASALLLGPLVVVVVVLILWFDLDPMLGVAVFLMGSGRLVIEVERALAYWQDRAGRAFAFSAAASALFVLATVADLESSLFEDWQIPFWRHVLSTLVVALVIVVVHRAAPFPSDYQFFLAKSSAKWRDSTMVFLAGYGVGFLIPILISKMSSYSATAGIRAAQSLVGIPLQLPRALFNPFTVRVSRSFASRGVIRNADLLLWCIFQIALMAPLVIVIDFVPESLGVMVLGESWKVTQPVIAWILLSSLLAQLVETGDIYYRARMNVRPMALVRTVGAVPLLGGVSIGATTHGALGAAVGLTAGWGLLLLITCAIVVRRQVLDRQLTGVSYWD